MEIGSPEHKQLLTKSIVKIAVKTISIGLVIGLFLMFPSLVRENAFSNGLAIAGQVIIIITLIYAFSIAFSKYWKTLRNL
ncbi:hypothetical protein [Hydrogenovibrio marinus]|uniref:Uncharacterized protein n=1 Tax=Hydrogenovibrio marinus TaxID=28885 RepID=A0A067A0V8_HYDMR|nr:hypothetical protein [Hydrogenovibrio marinus]KDN96005.1 hypothetical protein EI16_06880 [Hydrogenovibrio marinus]BBN58500.1 hypothetical protein HVMH_0094 [Hydrogenovibrio marinus]